MAAMKVGIEAARWVIARALGPASDGVLEAWAASSELGPNVRALRMELLYAQGLLNNARGHGYGQGPDIRNPALGELLQELRGLAYRADDVMDELDYFRIQDELDGTYHAADEHGRGCLRNCTLNARHTTRAISNMLGSFFKCSCGSTDDHGELDEDKAGRGVSCGACPCLGPKTPDDNDDEEARPRARCGALWPCRRASSTPSSDQQEDVNQSEQDVEGGCMARIASSAHHTIQTVGKHLPCYSASPLQNASTGSRFLCCARPNRAPQVKHTVQTPKLKFNRVDMSRTMKKIVEQLKPLCAKVSAILNLEFLAANCSTPRGMATSPPISTSESIEPELYGREHEKSSIIHDITQGAYCHMDLTVLPIVGPGGIGKTTLTQYIYNDKEVQSHFEVKLWVCVSVNFDLHRLIKEIADKLENETKDRPDNYKVVEERLKSKRFLLVLDDMWDFRNEDVWKRFLVPFKYGQKGSVILVTTRFPASAQLTQTMDHWEDLEGLNIEDLNNLFLAYVFGNKKPEHDHSELLDVGHKITKKLKGSPLAAKTVGRLLRKHLDWNHWTSVLESKEWESESGDHEIMPALKLSFDYLPFHLQQCFTYCTLFPEDYRFGQDEIIHFWIGLDALHSHGENKRIEDIGLSHLTELVDHGFLKKEEDTHGHTCYVIHDLLHELGVKVSSHECLTISSSDVRSLIIPQSIRHLSINIDDSCVKDMNTFNICKEDFSVLKNRLKVENLQSLMLFGRHQDSFVKTFHGLFNKAKALRLIFISGVGYSVEDLLHSFMELVHLRYLRVGNAEYKKSQIPKNISRFYHLRVLDLQRSFNEYDLSIHMGNLVNLRHLLVPYDIWQSNICQVGKLKSLQELRRFQVRKESQGFELRQIGHLLELCGSLSINNLEKVEGEKEAEEAKLMHKRHIHELQLKWDGIQSTDEDQVLEGLKPHSNLLKLSIYRHGGTTCPSWLGLNLSVKNLEYLCLYDVAWDKFPPIGELQSVSEGDKVILSNIPDQHFNNLKTIELRHLATLIKWVVDSRLFSHLEELTIVDCPELVELSFPNSSCRQQEQKNRFLMLRKLDIHSCPKLSSLPPVPWTTARCSVWISEVGLCFNSLSYKEDYGDHLLSLSVIGKDAQGSDSLWMSLDFDKLIGVKRLDLCKCPPMPLDRLQMLVPSLNILQISQMNNAICVDKDGSHVPCQFPGLESMSILFHGASAKELTQVLACLPKLSELNIWGCDKIAGLGVVEQQQQQQQAQRGRQQNKSREEDDEGLLLLPPTLQKLDIGNCPEISLMFPDENGGLQALSYLHSLHIQLCPKLLSRYLSSPSPSCFPFPASLHSLELRSVEMLAPLSNLASLTSLSISDCRGDFKRVGVGHLLAHGCLQELYIYRTPNFFTTGSEELSVPSSKLQWLSTNDVAGVLAEHICRFLSSSLTGLTFGYDLEIERLTEKQDKALQHLTSLQALQLEGLSKLQCLQVGLQSLTKLEALYIFRSPGIQSLPKHTLPNSLRGLEISKCSAFRSLPKGCLPDSLQDLAISNCSAFASLPTGCLPGSLRKLIIHDCSAITSLPKGCLPDSLQELRIAFCPSIRALPKGGPPSSLLVLNVSDGNSEELTRQCRTLKGTIPIVEVD